MSEDTNFSATTPSRGRPPPHWAVSGPKKLIFVFFVLLPERWAFTGAAFRKICPKLRAKLSKLECISFLVATITFSPFTCSFHRFLGRLLTGFVCNENAKCTQSLLCSHLTTFTGECNHSHAHSLFTANGSSECSSMHLSVGDYQHRRKSLKANRQTDLRKGGE